MDISRSPCFQTKLEECIPERRDKWKVIECVLSLVLQGNPQTVDQKDGVIVYPIDGFDLNPGWKYYDSDNEEQKAYICNFERILPSDIKLALWNGTKPKSLKYLIHGSNN